MLRNDIVSRNIERITGGVTDISSLMAQIEAEGHRLALSIVKATPVKSLAVTV